MEAGQTVHGVQEHICDIAALRDVHRGEKARRKRREISKESVGRCFEDAVAMDVEMDVVGGYYDGIWQTVIGTEGWREVEEDGSMFKYTTFLFKR